MKKTKCLLMAAFISLMVPMGYSPAQALFESYGSLVPSGEVTQDFDNYRTDTALNYYFSGSESWPDALIGLNKAYTLDSTLWRKVEGTPEAFKKLVTGMKSRPSVLPLHGHAILDNQGRQIGVWYSFLGVRGYVKMEGEKNVDISTPVNPIHPELNAP